jgi:ribosome-associated toxin RatA of RatAB toxin-antitoxin module
MKTFESSIEIGASAQALFDLTQDYDRRLSWDPFLCEARLLDGATAAGLGVRAWCVAKAPRVGMETEYVSFNPPRVAAVKMTRGPWVFESFAGSWRFDELSPGRTRVTFRYSLTTRPAALRPVVAAVFNREMRQRLAGLKAMMERPAS